MAWTHSYLPLSPLFIIFLGQKGLLATRLTRMPPPAAAPQHRIASHWGGG